MGQGHTSNTCAEHDTARQRAGQKARRTAQRSAGRRRVGTDNTTTQMTTHRTRCSPSRNRVTMQHGTAWHTAAREARDARARTEVRPQRHHRDARASLSLAQQGNEARRAERWCGVDVIVICHSLLPHRECSLVSSIFHLPHGTVLVVGLNSAYGHHLTHARASPLLPCNRDSLSDPRNGTVHPRGAVTDACGKVNDAHASRSAM